VSTRLNWCKNENAVLYSMEFELTKFGFHVLTKCAQHFFILICFIDLRVELGVRLQKYRSSSYEILMLWETFRDLFCMGLSLSAHSIGDCRHVMFIVFIRTKSHAHGVKFAVLPFMLDANYSLGHQKKLTF
jgi:hypothetical protein